MRLLVLLLGLLVLAPLLHEVIDLLVIDNLFLTAVFIYAVYSFNRSGVPAAVISAGTYASPLCAPPGGCGFPAEYEGDYFFSDYYAGFLRRLKGSGSSWAIAPPVPGQPGASNWGSGFDGGPTG